jgi:hypothetical protein
MAQKSAKKKAKKSPRRASEQSVLGSLRSTRPSRIGGERRTTARKTTATAAPAKPAKPKKAAAKPKAQAKVKPTKRVAPGPKPAPERVPPAPRDGRPSATEIATTAVQAAGELAQIGATVGGQLLKRAARRIPRP